MSDTLMKGRVVFEDVLKDLYDRGNKEYGSNEKPLSRRARNAWRPTPRPPRVGVKRRPQTRPQEKKHQCGQWLGS